MRRPSGKTPGPPAVARTTRIGVARSVAPSPSSGRTREAQASLADAARDEIALRRGADRLGVALDDTAIADLQIYLRELRRWAPRTDLLSPRDLAVVVERHILDSIVPALVLRELGPSARIADLGSGAGLPGVPLAIALRPARMLLVEARRRRATFLRAVARALPSLRLEIAACRTQALGRDTGEMDAVVSRAAMATDELFGAASRILCDHGRLLLYRGPRQPVDEPSTAGSARGTWIARGSLTYELPGVAASLRLDIWQWCFT